MLISTRNLRGKLENMEGVEDFESRPHKVVTFLVEGDREIQEVRELKMPECLVRFTAVVRCQEEARWKEEKKTRRRGRSSVAGGKGGGNRPC